MAYGTSEHSGQGDIGEVEGVPGIELAVIVPELGQVLRGLDRIRTIDEVSPWPLDLDPTTGTCSRNPAHMPLPEGGGFGDELDSVGAAGAVRMDPPIEGVGDLGKVGELVRA